MPIQSETFCNKYINTELQGTPVTLEWPMLLCIGEGTAERVNNKYISIIILFFLCVGHLFWGFWWSFYCTKGRGNEVRKKQALEVLVSCSNRVTGNYTYNFM